MLNPVALALALSFLAHATPPSLTTGTSTAQDPTFTFSTPGQYTVTLKSCNGGGCSTATKTITVLDPTPQVGPILGLAVVGISNGPVTYTASAAGRPPLASSWTVTPPDMAFLTSSAPALTFTPNEIGTYNLKFQVLNLWGSRSSTLAVSAIPTAFTDVAPTDFAASYIEAIYYSGITAGCASDPTTGSRTFCPANTVSRAELAVFIGVAYHGFGFSPPPATGVFSDVPPTFWAGSWIEQAYRDGFARGCTTGSHPQYCPQAAATREDIAQQTVRAAHGPAFTAPPAVGIFADVPVTDPAAPWVEQLYHDGVTAGCQGPPVRLFCPLTTVTRAEMAVFLVREFHLSEKPTPLLFAARLCSASSCAFPTTTPIQFDVQLRGGIPASYDYDWNGDGTYEESVPFPSSHAYTSAGTFTPRLRIHLGSWTAVITHPYPIRITTSSGFLSPPASFSATALRQVPPGLTDPPGTPVQTSYSVSTALQTGVLGYAAYLNPGTGTYTFVGLLQPNRSTATDSLLLPPPNPGAIRYVYLRPFSSTTLGTPSFSVRIP